MAYADVQIRIFEQQVSGYPVEITVAGEGEPGRGYLDPAAQPPSPTDNHYADPAYGQRLYDWFFADDRLKKIWARVRGAHSSRRIRLRIDPSAAALHTVPWEALCEPQEGQRPALHLAAASATPFSRYLAVDILLGAAVSRRPVRILVVACQQVDFEEKYLKQYPSMAVIDPQAEFGALRRVLQPSIDQGRVELTLLDPPATLARIGQELRRGSHGLHLVCHGLYDEQSKQAALLLADADNRVVRETDEAIAAMLGQQLVEAGDTDGAQLRLVFLASCQSATRSPADAFRGLAPRLVAAGVPAVVAMQDQVDDETARQFAATFYERLLQHGQVDRAVNEARLDLMAARLPGPVIPVLFMRLRDGRLFAKPETAPARRRLQAPPPPDTFAGRVAVLERLGQALTSQPDAQVAVAIQGTGGQGKSTVAMVLGQRLEPHFPGGVLWVDVGPGAGEGSPDGAAGSAASLAGQQDSIVGRVALELGLDLKDVPLLEDRTAIVKRELDAGVRLLAILDDVWDADLGRWLMQELLPDRRAVLITSRLLDVAKALGSRVERLGVLSQDEGVEMLSRFLGPLGRHEGAARKVVDLLEGMPLALELAARRCDEGAADLRWLLRQLRSKPTLGVLTLPGQASRETSVEYTLSLSLQGLDEDLARRFRALGVFAAAPFDLAALAAVWQDDDRDEAEEAARALVRRALLGRGEERLPAGAEPEFPVYVQHALLRVYALALAQGAGEAEAAAAGHAAYFRALPGESWQQGELFWPQVEHAWRWVDGRSLDERLEFLQAMKGFAYRRGLWEPVRRRAEDLLAVLQASGERQEDHASLSVTLGYIASALGDKAQALEYYEQALPLRRQVGDKGGEATTLNNIGGVYSDLGDKAQALEYYEQALPLQRQVGDRWGESITCYNMGTIYAGLGDLARAELLLRRTVELDEAIDHPDLESDRAALEEVRNRLQAQEELGRRLLPLVRQARDGDQELATQLVPALEQLASREDMPPEVQILGHVLQQLLAGATTPDLSGLPAELATAVGAAFDLPQA